MSTADAGFAGIVGYPNIIGMTMPMFWGLREVARYAGVTYNSARTYHGRAEINRRAGDPKPGDLPPPDARFGNSPVWRPETIVRWYTIQRPGRGAGGGRPPRKSQEKKS